VVCDRLAAELADGSRIVAATEHWTAYVPFAAKWPFEVHVVPHRHVRGLPDLDATERDELALLWRDLFRRYDALFAIARVPTIAAWHQTPADAPDGHLVGQAFSLQRDEGKRKYLAGSESAYGAWMLDVPAERAAELLRAAG
jgi:UDPglucose--hexose-1-phosphate uridylyltransferase